MNTSSQPDTLAAAVARHQLDLPDEQLAQLDRYCQLLWQWNEKLNLTRHTDYERFVSRDLVDSLMLERLLEPGERVLDVGTGGGVPGIVLAIVQPELDVSLCESVGKKAKVVKAIVESLELPISVHHASAQQTLEQHSFHTLVARAVAPLDKLLTWLAPHWNSFDRLLIVKGPAWVEERKNARERGLLSGLDLRKLTTYPLPGTEVESVILSIRPKD